jgi:regulator of replication initiation timing
MSKRIETLLKTVGTNCSNLIESIEALQKEVVDEMNQFSLVNTSLSTECGKLKTENDELRLRLSKIQEVMKSSEPKIS